MSKQKEDMYNQLKHLFEQNKLNIPDAIMHPRWRDTMERKVYFTGVDPASDSDTTLLGMKVRYSNFVEDDTVYLVSNPKTFGVGRIPRIETELYQEIQFKLQNLISQSMGVPASLFQDDWKRETTYNWNRFPDESVLEWGDRLFAKGLLDNPAIRWEYQKTVLGAPFNKLKSIWLDWNNRDE